MTRSRLLLNVMMLVLAPAGALGQDRFGEIQRGFERAEHDGSLLVYFVVGVIVLILLPVAAALVVRLRRMWRQPEHVAWRGMSRALGLNWSEQRLLSQVARQRGLQPAAALLISRGAFESAVTTYLSHGGVPERSKQQIQRLRRRIFG
jgi:hypothetical protein